MIIPTEVESEPPKGRERERGQSERRWREESKQVRIVPTEVELTGRERLNGREREKDGSKRSTERILLRKHGGRNPDSDGD